jgi:hypothetical protein
MNGPDALVHQYVDQTLNGADLGSVRALFAGNFRDHDPLRIPGVLEPGGPIGGIDDIEAQVRLLAGDGVDIRFTLEECFSGGEGRVAYRLFGEGTVPVMSTGDHRSTTDKRKVRKLGIAGTRLAFEGVDGPGGRIINDQLHVLYRCVGMFSIIQDRLAERWGAVNVT